MASKTQYFKVVDMQRGHHGVFYKLGINEDPVKDIPIENVRSCGRGAIYFTKLENLHSFIGFGDHIAWVTPISKVKADEDGDKWKAKKINITKILPLKEAALLLFPDLTELQHFGIYFSAREILESKTTPLDKKLEWLDDEGDSARFLKLVIENKNNKIVKNYVIKYSWNTSQIRALIKEGLESFIHEDDFSDLVSDREYSVITNLIKLNPNKYIKWLVDLY